jgi:hypothetical protein
MLIYQQHQKLSKQATVFEGLNDKKTAIPMPKTERASKLFPNTKEKLQIILNRTTFLKEMKEKHY